MAPQTRKRKRSSMTCPRCTDPATKLCSDCRNISYCSIECQQADRPSHKLLCKTFKDFAVPPSAGVSRIVLFHRDLPEPYFKWVPTNGGWVTGKVDLEHHKVPFEGDRMDCNAASTTSTNAWTDESLGYEIELKYDDEFHHNCAFRNQAVAAVTQGMNRTPYKEPFFAVCRPFFSSDPDTYLPDEQDSEEVDYGKILDIDLRMYADVVGFLIGCKNDSFKHRLRTGPKVDRIKISAEADRDDKVPSHEVVRVPRSHPIFNGKGTLSQVSERVSMPLLTWKYSTSPAVRNHHTTFMRIGCDPNAKAGERKTSNASFGWAPALDEGDLGTQLVASASWRDLSADHIEAFGDFCQWNLYPYFQYYEKEGGYSKTLAGGVKPSERVLCEITKAKWKEYLAQWKAEKEDAAAAKALRASAYTLEKASSGLERKGLTADDSERITSILSPSHRAYVKLFTVQKIWSSTLDISD